MPAPQLQTSFRSAHGARVDQWRAALGKGRAELRAAFDARCDPRRMLNAHSALVDRILREVWEHTAQSGKLALVAVGGYGRGTLYPYSDVDVLVLLPDSLPQEGIGRIEELVGLLWDIGLEIGHSVRSVAQCTDESGRDVTVQTSLLESRLVAGSRYLFRAFSGAMREALSVGNFTEAKLLEQQQRHTRFHDTAYNLEPNIKEGPGGLRDLQNILWIAAAAGVGASWAHLVRHRILTSEEAKQLKRHESVLAELRIRLHYAARRREDRLLFDYQGALAAQYGLEDSPGRRASELLMQRYYTTVKAVTLLNTIVLQNLRGRIFALPSGAPQVLNSRFQIRSELLETRGPGVFRREPGAIFEAFLLWQQHHEVKGLAVGTMRALWHARGRIDAAFRRDPANRARFLEMLRQPSGLTHTLRRMNQYGILGRYLPVFGRIVGQMQHDLFHVYTVDEHILMVVRNLRRFAVPEMAHEYPLCSRLISEFERPEVLYIAGLFHDIAKGRGGDHSTLGMRDARRFCRDHGLPKEDADLAVWLVQNHLYMSGVAQRQDLSDPDVIAEFVQTVRTGRRLAALYLLTVADIRGTSPKVWNAWKAKLLEDLFRLARRRLAPGTESAENTLQAKQARVVEKLRAYAIPEQAHLSLWRELDDGYFMRHDEQEIAWHTRVLNYRVATRSAVVKARLSPIGEGLQVMIYCPDEKSLFARICGFFATTNFSIAEARIYTTRHGYALDTFQVLDPSKATSHYRDLISYIEHELTQRLQAHGPLPPPTRGRLSRRVRNFPITPEVQIRPDEKGMYHYLSIIAGDRPGLLYRVARVLDQYGVSVRTAKINTLGERAEDSFLVSGEALNDPKAIVRLEAELVQELYPTP